MPNDKDPLLLPTILLIVMVIVIFMIRYPVFSYETYQNHTKTHQNR